MDVVTPEQAKIAEDAGAAAVMALERVPADIRRDGGVARMSDPEMIRGIQEAVTHPGDGQGPHRPLRRGAGARGARGRLRRRVRGAHAGRRGQPHRQVGLQDPVRVRRHQPRRGAAPDRRGRGDDPLQGRGRHRRHRRGRPPSAPDSAARSAGWPRSTTPSWPPRPRSSARRCISSARSPPTAGCPSCCSAPAGSPPRPTRRWSCSSAPRACSSARGIFKSEDPERRARAIVEATTHFRDPARVAAASTGLGQPMVSLETSKLESEQLLAPRGW